MKKKINKIIAMVMAIMMITSISISASEVKGDINGDGKLTASDARLVLRIAVRLDNADEETRKNADFDKDGKVTASDARLVLRSSLGLGDEPSSKPDSTTKEWTPADFKDGDGPEKWNPNDDVRYEGTKLMGDTKRIGMMYNEAGYRIYNLDGLKEGEWYTIYDEYGNRNSKTKPYSPGNEPTTEKDWTTGFCPDCGKRMGYTNEKGYACANGGCTQWIQDIACPECGEFVPAHTCHTCKN